MNKFLVLSDAGYGQTVRAKVDDDAAALAKAARLSKKGHTNIEIEEVTVVATTKYEVKE